MPELIPEPDDGKSQKKIRQQYIIDPSHKIIELLNK
jgi:hypothetical protein